MISLNLYDKMNNHQSSVLVQLYNFIVIVVCSGIGYGKITYLSCITSKAAGDIIREELHCMACKVKEAFIVEQSQNHSMPGWEAQQESASPAFLGKSTL